MGRFRRPPEELKRLLGSSGEAPQEGSHLTTRHVVIWPVPVATHTHRDPLRIQPVDGFGVVEPRGDITEAGIGSAATQPQVRSTHPGARR